MRWIEALKIWNAEKGGPWCVPRKGSPEHAIVKGSMAGKKPEPVEDKCDCEGESTCGRKVEKKKKKIRIVEEEEAPPVVIKKKKKIRIVEDEEEAPTIVIKKKKKVRVAEEEPPVVSAAAPAPAPARAPAPDKKRKSAKERREYTFEEVKPKIRGIIEENIALAKRDQNKMQIAYYEKKLEKLNKAKRIASGTYWGWELIELRKRGEI